MKKFSRYKVNASEMVALMSREQGNTPPSDKDLQDFLNIIEKDLIEITDSQKIKLQQFITRTVEYDKYSLSGTIKRSIYSQYSYLQYGVGRVPGGGSVPIQFEKGGIAEADAVKLLSKLDGVEYVKNEKLYSNRFFKGIPDILIQSGDEIVGVKDIKVSIDLPSFLERVDSDEVRSDRWEMLAYLDILDLKCGEICYCLVNMPEAVRNERLADAKHKMLMSGVDEKSIKIRIRQMKNDMIHDHVPEQNRVVRFNVQRRPWFTKQMRNRVRLVREKLLNLHEKFGKGVTLHEITEPPSPESTS